MSKSMNLQMCNVKRPFLATILLILMFLCTSCTEEKQKDTAIVCREDCILKEFGFESGYPGIIFRDMQRKKINRQSVTFDYDYAEEDAAREEVLLYQKFLESTEERTTTLKQSMFTHLCFHKNGVISCDKLNSTDQVCLGYKGLRKCVKSDEENYPLCIEDTSNRILTCGAHPGIQLCFTRSENSSFVRLCNEKDLPICLNQEGGLQECSELPVLFNTSEVTIENDTIDIDYESFENRTKWLNFWQEWTSRSDQVDEKNDFEIIELCMDRERLKSEGLTPDGLITEGLTPDGLMAEGLLFECKPNETDWNACISVARESITECLFLEDSDMPIPLCKKVISNRIVTCWNFTQAPLCVPKGQVMPADSMIPCTDKKRELCLKNDSKIDLCINLSTFPTTVNDNGENIDTEGETVTENGVLQLGRKHICIAENSEKLLQCDGDESQPVACIHANNFTLSTCKDVNDDYEIGIPICFEVETNFLVTCDILNNTKLCFGDNGELPIQPCSENLNYACLTQDGEPTACAEVRTQGNYPVQTDVSEQTSDVSERTTDVSERTTDVSDQTSDASDDMHP